MSEPSLPMSGERLVWCLEQIGWSHSELARRTEIEEVTIRRMLRGLRHIPDNLALWLEHLAAMHRAHPMPKEWVKRSELRAAG